MEKKAEESRKERQKSAVGVRGKGRGKEGLEEI